MPGDGGTVTILNYSLTESYVYDVHDRLIYEYTTDYDEPDDKYGEQVYLLQAGRRVAIFEPAGTGAEVTQLLLPDPTADRMLAEEDRNPSPRTIWPLHDHQGTVIAAFSDGATPKELERLEYDALGRPLLDFTVPSLGNANASGVRLSFYTFGTRGSECLACRGLTSLPPFTTVSLKLGHEAR